MFSTSALIFYDDERNGDSAEQGKDSQEYAEPLRPAEQPEHCSDVAKIL